jgi:hypothetical protein
VRVEKVSLDPLGDSTPSGLHRPILPAESAASSARVLEREAGSCQPSFPCKHYFWYLAAMWSRPTSVALARHTGSMSASVVPTPAPENLTKQ